MSITSTVARIQYTLSGAGQVLIVPFKFINATDLAVVKTVSSVDTPLVISTNYTVALDGTAPNTGTVTMIGGTSGDIITIYRDADLTQPASFISNDRFPASTNETGLDRGVGYTQQHDLQIERALRVPVTNGVQAPLTLAARTSKYLAFDSNGDAVPLSGTGSVPADASLSLVTATGTTTGRGLAARLADFFNVKDFGVKGDGVTDDSASLQAALTAIQGTTTALFFPNGIYCITVGLTLVNGNFNCIYGTGAATIKWTGAAGAGIMLTLSDCYGVTVSSLKFISATNAIATGIWLKNDGGLSSTVPTSCRLQNLSIDGGSGKIGKCVLVGGTGSLDANNDFHYLDNCVLTNYSIAGLSLESSQIYNVMVVNCRILSNGYGQYGIVTDLGGGAANLGGSFQMIGGAVGNNTVADFKLGTPHPAPIVIENVISESSARLLLTDGPTPAAFFIVLRNVRWAYSVNVAADKKVIWHKTGGTFLIENCNIGEGGQNDGLLYILENNAPTLTGFTILNCYFYSNAADAFGAAGVGGSGPNNICNTFVNNAGTIARYASNFQNAPVFRDGILIGAPGGSIAPVSVTQFQNSPEGSVTASIGSLFLRRDGTPGTCFYTKEVGTGNTGWKAHPAIAPGTLTLTASAGTTTISNTAVTASSMIFITPTSANAAADQGSATGVWISAKVAATSFTLTHPNNANADKTFNYEIVN